MGYSKGRGECSKQCVTATSTSPFSLVPEDLPVAPPPAPAPAAIAATSSAKIEAMKASIANTHCLLEAVVTKAEAKQVF